MRRDNNSIIIGGRSPPSSFMNGLMEGIGWGIGIGLGLYLINKAVEPQSFWDNLTTNLSMPRVVVIGNSY